MYRKAQKQDIPALLQLWRQVFGDDDAFITRCLNVFAGPGQVYVAEQGGLDAMLLAVPCEMDNRQGAYLYALATRPRRRGAGVMSGLMQYAEQAEQAGGAQFAALIPAADGLYSFYQKRGYAAVVCLRQVCRQAAAPVPGTAPDAADSAKRRRVSWLPMEDAAAQRFLQLRERYIHMPYVRFSAERGLLIWQDLVAAGARLAECDEGYGVYFAGMDTLLAAELFAESQAAADTLLLEICRRERRRKILATLPQASPLFAGEGEAVRGGLIKYFTAPARQEKIYMRFALDETAPEGTVQGPG